MVGEEEKGKHVKLGGLGAYLVAVVIGVATVFIITFSGLLYFQSFVNLWLNLFAGTFVTIGIAFYFNKNLAGSLFSGLITLLSSIFIFLYLTLGGLSMVMM